MDRRTAAPSYLVASTNILKFTKLRNGDKLQLEGTCWTKTMCFMTIANLQNV